MNYKDYYQVLGVNPRAATEDIRAAYKKLAVQYHPDRNPGNTAAENRFKEISEAKEILLDADNRRQYDALRMQYIAQQQMRRHTPRAGVRPQPQESSQTDGSGIFSSFFDEVFGRGRRQPRRGKNLEAHIKISLEEAYHGTRDVLKFEGRKLRIRIKPGMRDGQTLRIKGQGGAGQNGGPSGDLFLTIKIKPHPVFTRKEDDLYVDQEVDLYTAVLGQKVQIPSLKGTPVKVQIPAGTQSGERLKLKGLGMPDHDHPGAFGDLYLKVRVNIPRKLSPEQRALFERLASSD